MSPPGGSGNPSFSAHKFRENGRLNATQSTTGRATFRRGKSRSEKKASEAFISERADFLGKLNPLPAVRSARGNDTHGALKTAPARITIDKARQTSLKRPFSTERQLRRSEIMIITTIIKNRGKTQISVVCQNRRPSRKKSGLLVVC